MFCHQLSERSRLATDDFEQRNSTKKTGGYIAWHGYQSFKPDEVTPEQCHEIGLKLAREMWGGKYQIIVATHLDKGASSQPFLFQFRFFHKRTEI